jgi:hypothetical protein
MVCPEVWQFTDLDQSAVQPRIRQLPGQQLCHRAGRSGTRQSGGTWQAVCSYSAGCGGSARRCFGRSIAPQAEGQTGQIE